METNKNYNEVTYEVTPMGWDLLITFSNGIEILVSQEDIDEEDLESPDDYADAWSQLIIEAVEEQDVDFAQFLKENDEYTRNILEE